MELIKELGLRPKMIKTGALKGTIKNNNWGLFECPSCKAHIEHIIYTGKQRKSCGKKGCKAATSNKYGHRKLPDGTAQRDNPHYNSFNDFYNRNIKFNHHRSERWGTFNNFKEDMFESYINFKEKGIKAVTLYVLQKGTIEKSNVKWVKANTTKVSEYTYDIDNNIYHSKRLAMELNTCHQNVAKSMQRLMEEFDNPALQVLSVPGYISTPDAGYILTKEQYYRVLHKFTDARNNKLKSEYVYLISGGGFTKIGITRNVKARFQTLVGSSPVALELLNSFKVPNASTVEKYLHNKYKDFNHHHEWFKLSEEQIEEIKEYLESHKLMI